ncbi:putative quinol monooxygenase [Asticcacaulis solisilvae]|uniref:putative quinol monooxygenase n=1 Tax=Asticcacaulis solisilvae TaxID=1217274 RepID=UPI003FD8F8AF
MTTPVTLINILSVEPGNQQALVASLKGNTETVIMSLKGWISTRLVASHDGKRVVIYSEWETAADVDAMRADPRMTAYFPHVAALASLDSMLGTVVMTHGR